MILTCLAFAALAQTNQMKAEIGKLEVPLTFQAFDTIGGQSRTMMLEYGAPSALERSKRIQSYKLPQNMHSPRLFKISLKDLHVMAVTGKSKNSLDCPDQLRIDWNGDKVFSDSEKAVSIYKDSRFNPQDRSSLTYRLFRPQTRKGQAGKFLFVALNDQLETVTGGIMIGKAPIGKGLKIGVADAEKNGRYDDVFRNGEYSTDYDLLFIDRNRNGRFDEKDLNTPDYARNWEVMPLMSRVEIDGKFYGIDVDPDGKSLTLTSVPKPYAKLNFDGGRVPLLALEYDQGILECADRNGTIEYPPGTYRVIQFSYSFATPKGDRWLARIVSQEVPKIQLNAGKETHRRIGLPLSLKLEAVENNFSIDFYLQIRDAGGNILYILENAKGAPPSPPMLVITDLKGKIVKKIQYDSEHSSVEWRPAKSVKWGDYKASVKWNMGTLGTASTKIKFKVKHYFDRNPNDFYDRAKS